jgi:hypothetical protein
MLKPTKKIKLFMIAIRLKRMSKIRKLSVWYVLALITQAKKTGSSVEIANNGHMLVALMKILILYALD